VQAGNTSIKKKGQKSNGYLRGKRKAKNYFTGTKDDKEKRGGKANTQGKGKRTQKKKQEPGIARKQINCGGMRCGQNEEKRS